MLGEKVAGKYELKRLLGSGSMGAVYEGVHVDIGKRLAIKLIHQEFGNSAEVVARFRREARAASSVESDFIVQIYDFGRDDRLGLYMVIEYLEGEDLEARLARERWIAEVEAATLGIQIARGLSRAHAAGVIHRDLKPANVFLIRRDDGASQVKILDFGISKVESEVPSSGFGEPTLTAQGMTLGTPQYMAPEQCEGLADVDARADVWALATLLYEMLAGEPAVPDQGGYIAIMNRIVHEPIPPLAKRASWVSPKLAAVVDAGLARDRRKRIPDAATFVALLQQAIPDAGSRPSFNMMVVHPTDISELAPITGEHAPVTIADPRVVADARLMLADTGNPASVEPPSSSGGEDEQVAIFERGQGMPRELAELRAKRNPR